MTSSTRAVLLIASFYGSVLSSFRLTYKYPGINSIGLEASIVLLSEFGDATVKRGGFQDSISLIDLVFSLNVH